VAARGKVLGIVTPAPRLRERRLLDRSSSVILLARRFVVVGFGAAPLSRTRLIALACDVQLLHDREHVARQATPRAPG